MAEQERKKENLFIKEKRRARNFFVTSSAKMDGDKVTKTTISSSHFTEMSKSFDNGEHLTDSGIRELNGPILYMLQEMQQDIDDVYNEVSASSFQASYFPFATIDTGSFGLISSSLIPHLDSKHDLGSSGKEWNNLYVDGTAYVDAINLNGTAIARTAAELNAVTSKLPLAGGTMTGLIRPIVSAIKEEPKNNEVDARKVNVLECNAKKAMGIGTMTPLHPGQIVTIMNVGQGTVTIKHTAKSASGTFFIYGGKDLAILTGQAYRFISDSQIGFWTVIQ